MAGKMYDEIKSQLDISQNVIWIRQFFFGLCLDMNSDGNLSCFLLESNLI